jgi:hypothetical protein
MSELNLALEWAPTVRVLQDLLYPQACIISKADHHF